MKRLAGAVLYVLYLALVLEVLSFAYFRLELGRLSHAPVYALPEGAVDLPSIAGWYTHHSPWGAWHRPGTRAAHINWCYEAYYSSNSDGARDVERSREGRDRAVFLGDSFVEGFTVNDRERLTHYLEERYGLPVLNFGTGGHFGPLQYEILYRELVRRFDHRRVFVGILPDNDFTDNDLETWRRRAEFRELYRPYYGPDGTTPVFARDPPGPESDPLMSPLRRVLELGRQYTWSFGLLKEIRRVMLEREHRGESGGRSYAGYRDATPAQVRNVLGSLGRIAAMARAEGREMTVVLFPRPTDYALAPAEAWIGAAFQAFGAEAGVQVIDLRERVPYDRDLFRPCDGHWSPRGNQAAAEAIVAALPVP